MRIADIAEATFRFHRAVYVSLTEKCPIRCRHCFVESAPTREEHADVERFAGWIEGVAATPGLEVAFFSGGEPFSHPLALRSALQACRRHGVYPVVCTSGFFGKSEVATDRLFDAFAQLACLYISTDVFHEEFVPLTHLRTVVVRAEARGIRIGFQIVDDDPEHSPFLRRFTEVLGDLVQPDQIVIVPLAKQGRAERELTAAEEAVLPVPESSGFEAVPCKACAWLATPWIREDGVVSACPNLGVFRAASHPLQLGDLNEASYTVLAQRADEDPYLQALRVFGPSGIVGRYRVEEYGWDRSSFTGTSICDLCHSLAAVPDLVERVREEARANGDDEKLDVLRYALYGEMRPRLVP
ncbi:MAG: hypothetical protein NVS3B7_00840 [Candidatus Elarobacter sp.]